MDRFLPFDDALAKLINTKSEELFLLLQPLNARELGLSEHGIHYFNTSHLNRLFFSVQTSAHILYGAINLLNKQPSEICLMDYGAGIGSLYLLAKMIGCKKVIYNDLLEEWKMNAQCIAKAIHWEVDNYLVGDIEITLDNLAKEGVSLDIITSRNVIEHIYELTEFYSAVKEKQPNALIYSSTTANFHNPAMNVQHVLWHRKWKPTYEKQRLAFLTKNYTSYPAKELKKLAKQTNGYRFCDLEEWLSNEDGKVNGKPPKKYVYTNTCEPEFGVWAENLLPYQLHKIKGKTAGYDIHIKAGFWDTHYTKKWKSQLGNFCNNIAQKWPILQFVVAPFIYVIAIPETSSVD
jgi:2-polyprenyl-3-methyl-5-hydroxy-6-metoxy-1,4-benzoquinol methylase